MTKNLFNLEQEILECWRVSSDIETVLSMIGDNCSTDKITSALSGMKELYEKKFEILFDTFETCITKRQLDNNIGECKEKTRF